MRKNLIFHILLFHRVSETMWSEPSMCSKRRKDFFGNLVYLDMLKGEAGGLALGVCRVSIRTC